MSKTTYRIPDSVVEDTHAYRREVEKFLAGETSPVAFRAIRVPMGIYEQRESDTYMVRVRGAAGVFLPDQIRTVSSLARTFGNGIVHVTTRQDLQIHKVLIDDTPAMLERLLEDGLSSRGGGGNTVRNVSACPLAGICADEVFDVTPYVFALTEHLITDRANFNLPRKFKVAFSGCGKDCGLSSVADVGFFAHEKDGIRGFAVYAAGGMGTYSSLGTLIEEFVPADAIFEVAEAVKRLFDEHGDRTHKHKARLRFVLERLGRDEFIRLYRMELAKVRQEGISTPDINLACEPPQAVTDRSVEGTDSPAYLSWRLGCVLPQRQDGLFAASIPLRLGDIPAEALHALVEIAEATGDGTLRTTQEQNLQIRGIPESRLPELYRSLLKLDEPLTIAPPVSIVACTGASTCKLGLCLSRGLADAIESELREADASFDAPIRISGCPNSCGHHPIAAIGLHGGAVRSDGRLVPTYTILAGGNLAEGRARLAQPVAKVPAKAVPTLLKEFLESASQARAVGESASDLMDRWGTECLRTLSEKYASIPRYDEAPEFYRDFGSEEEFSLAGRGPGECGAGVMDVIALDIDEARRALDEGRLYEAVVAAARSLLVTRGIEPKKDREVFAAFSEHLIEPGWVSPRAQVLLDAALDFRLGDRDTLDDLREDIRALLERVQELFRSLDSNLSFRVSPIEETTSAQRDISACAPPYEGGAGQQAGGGSNTETPSARRPVPLIKGDSVETPLFDLRGVLCPMNFVHAKIRLEQVEMGDALDILLDGGEPARNVPASFADQGQEVVSVAEEGDHFRVRVRRMQ